MKNFIVIFKLVSLTLMVAIVSHPKKRLRSSGSASSNGTSKMFRSVSPIDVQSSKKGFFDVEKIEQFSKKLAQLYSLISTRGRNFNQAAAELQTKGGSENEMMKLQQRMQHLQMVSQAVLQKLHECLAQYMMQKVNGGWQKIYKQFKGGEVYKSSQYLKSKGYVDLTYEVSQFVDREFAKMLDLIEQEFKKVDEMDKANSKK